VGSVWVGEGYSGGGGQKMMPESRMQVGHRGFNIEALGKVRVTGQVSYIGGGEDGQGKGGVKGTVSRWKRARKTRFSPRKSSVESKGKGVVGIYGRSKTAKVIPFRLLCKVGAVV